jgi:hypothetical protein
MPYYIQCSNTFCDGRAEKLGDLCEDCKRRAEEERAKREANEWRWAGFRKSTDQHRKGWKK